MKLLLALCVTFVAGCGRAPVKGAVGKEFDTARSQILRSNFQEAVVKMESFYDDHRDHELASRASFLIAKAHMGLNDFAESKRWFETTISRYPNSEEAHKSKFKLAMLAVMQEEDAQAIQLLEMIRDTSPGPYAPEVRAWLNHLEQPNDALAQ